MSSALEHLLNQHLFIPFGREYKGQNYDSTIVLNGEKVYEALEDSKSIYPFVPEFYDDNCPLDLCPTPIIEQSEIVGKGHFGAVYLIKINNEKLKGKIKIPVVLKSTVVSNEIIRKPRDSKYVTDPFSNEIINSTLVSNLFSQGLCPHFPLFFGFFLCKNKLEEVVKKGGYDQDIIVNAKPLTGYILIEALDSNLQSSNDVKIKGYRQLLRQGMENNARTLKNIAFQVIFAIAKMQEQYALMHNDLHEGNIVIALTKDNPYIWNGINLNTPDSFLKYKIGRKRFFLQNRYVLAKISDFGLSGAFGYPEVRLEATEKITKEREFSLHNRKFRKGFDLAYFVMSFTQITCFESYEIANDPIEKQEILNLAKTMSLDLLEFYYESEEPKRKRSARELRKEFRKIKSFSALYRAMISEGLFKHTPPNIPSKQFARNIEPLDFLRFSDTFDEYRKIKVAENIILMATHSGKSAKELWGGKIINA